MIEQAIIDHHIQKHILKVLVTSEYARFSEMRPPRTDSNLYSYHLNKLISSGYITKTKHGYTLSYKGLQYIDYASANINIRNQSKITTAILLKDLDGKYLLIKRTKQPYINYYGLPLGKLHTNKDKSILDAARRELVEKTGLKCNKLTHAGDMYLKIHLDKILISDLLIHVFMGIYKHKHISDDNLIWVDNKEMSGVRIIPGVREIIRAVESGERFFKEVSV